MQANGEEMGTNGIVAADEAAKADQKTEDVKTTYKSFKKKFRKLRAKFDDKMRRSNEWYMREQKAEEQMKRLAQENDQLLDLLLDINNSAQIPAEKRIDMSVDVPPLSDVPPLVKNDDLSKCAELDTPAGRALYKEIRSMLEEKAAVAAAAAATAKNAPKSSKPLSLLMATVPHHSVSSPLVSADLLSTLEVPEGHAGPITYLTADQIDDYLYDVDALLGTAPPAPPPQHPAPHDVALRNPNSVYNWLRKNEPKVFLQDNEGSDKTLGKPGSLRGAGKRASMPAPAKPGALEFVEEDGLGYDAALAGPVSATKGKRKREDGDDSTYHPSKGQRLDENGKPRVKRAYNRKKKPEGSGDAATAAPAPAKKSKKEKAKQASPPPAQHPFGGPL